MALFKRNPKLFGEITPLEMMEQGFYMLRSLSIGELLPLLASSGLFLWGLLSAFADLSQSGESRRTVVEWGIILTGLYLHMKVWQSIFSRWIWQRLLGGKEMTALGWRTALRQTCALWGMHAWSFPLHFIAAILLPLAWVYAGYQACTTLVYTRSLGSSAGRELWKQAYQASLYQPIHNHTLLAFLFGFGAIVWAATYFMAIFLPYLLHVFTGEQNVMTLYPYAYSFNTLLIISTIGLSWMLTSPFFRIVYTLRLFYAVSRHTGEDLIARMKMLGRRAAVVLLLSGYFSSSSSAQSPESKSLARVPTANEIRELARQIENTTSSPEYRWAPRPKKSLDVEKIAEEQGKWSWLKWVKSFFKKVGVIWQKIKRAIFGDKEEDEKNDSFSTGKAWWSSWHEHLETWIWISLAVFVLAAGYCFYLWRKKKKQPTPSVKDARLMPSEDWQENDAAAANLADDEWLRLAQEQISQGDYRRAVRALYLASLACLHEQKFVRLHRAKTNREYRRELVHYAVRRPEVQSAFGETVKIFEKVWYGHFMPDESTVRLLRSQYERIASEEKLSHVS